MLFENTDRGLMAHNVKDLMQHIITAMRLLEVEGAPLGKRAEAAHKELYQAMEKLVDASVANDYEYHFMLHIASIKVVATSTDSLSRVAGNGSHL